MNETAKPGAPWHYWVAALVSLLWNAFGGYDYVMTRSRNAEYLSSIGDPAEIMGWVDSMPLLTQLFWPIGVWASVLGSVLLLMRSRHAVIVFLVSLVGAAISFGAQYSVPLPPSLDTTANKVMPLVILAVIALQWWYARRSAARGWLR